jgi:hypothetical protein
MSTGSGIIYKLDFPSKKSYIGLTEQTLKDRLASHALRSSKCPQVKKAIAKYGWSTVIVTVLVELPAYLLPEYEKKFIDIYDTYRRGYNATPGGDMSPMTCPEVAAKSRATLLQPERQQRKIATYKETRADPVVAQRYVDGLKRAHADPEKSARYRAGWKAAQSKPEAREKQSKIQKVAQNRPETVKKRSESVIAAWALRKPNATPEDIARRAKLREQAAKRRARTLEAARLPRSPAQRDEEGEERGAGSSSGQRAPSPGRSTPPPAAAHGAGASDYEVDLMPSDYE